jgi:hypothetical protein
MINFWGSLDYDIGCTIFCKVHFELNIYPFNNFSFGFERLECRFQFFISFLPSFLNKFEYNATIFDSLLKIAIVTSKKIHCSVLLHFSIFLQNLLHSFLYTSCQHCWHIVNDYKKVVQSSGYSGFLFSY